MVPLVVVICFCSNSAYSSYCFDKTFLPEYTICEDAADVLRVSRQSDKVRNEAGGVSGGRFYDRCHPTP